jgi:hypothetical protein
MAHQGSSGQSCRHYPRAKLLGGEATCFFKARVWVGRYGDRNDTPLPIVRGARPTDRFESTNYLRYADEAEKQPSALARQTAGYYLLERSLFKESARSTHHQKRPSALIHDDGSFVLCGWLLLVKTFFST